MVYYRKIRETLGRNGVPCPSLAEKFRLVRGMKRHAGNTVRSGSSELTVGRYGVAHVTAPRGYFFGNDKLRWYHDMIVLCCLAGDGFLLGGVL